MISTGTSMSRTKRIGDIRAYSSGSSMCTVPCSTRNTVPMSLVYSSVNMLFTARSLQIALNFVPVVPANHVAM